VLLAWLLWRWEPDGVALALVWAIVFELISWTLLTGVRSRRMESEPLCRAISAA